MPEKWTGELVGKMHNNRVRNEELAKEMGVTASYVSMILNGKRTTANAKERLEQAYDRVMSKRGTEAS